MISCTTLIPYTPPISPEDFILAVQQKAELDSRLDKAAKKFDFWMKEFTHHIVKPHGEKLLEWMDADAGGDLISKFDEFIGLVKKLNECGYQFQFMPTQDQFVNAMTTFVQRKISMGEKRPELESVEFRLEAAVKKFDFWMKRYDHCILKPHGEKLLDWIHHDAGGLLVLNFDEIVLLANRLNGNGYQIDIMPTEEQFDEVMSLFKQRRSQREVLVRAQNHFVDNEFLDF